MEVTVGVILSLITAFGGAFFGARLSLNRYYQEKWWDKKVEAYSQIIEALFKVFIFSNNHYDYENGEIEVMTQSRERVQKLRNEFIKGNEDLEKAIYMSDFIFSENASEVLINFNKEWSRLKVEEEKSGYAELELLFDRAKLVHDCLEKIKRIAKKDLQVH